jgi:uracil-DNA glycosylase
MEAKQVKNTDHEALALLADLDPAEASGLAAYAASQQPWPGVLDDAWTQPWYGEIRQAVNKARGIYDGDPAQQRVFPSQSEVFAAFHLTSFEKIKVVLIGQDPYPSPGEAMGLAFSVHKDTELPTSLKNIHIAMRNDGFNPPPHGDLTGWARQGVLLLNLALTTPRGGAGRHLSLWRPFTQRVLKAIDSHPEPVVFVLWGAKSQQIKRWNIVDFNRHGLVEAPHPAARKEQQLFRRAETFSKVNDLLVGFGREAIRWDDLSMH